MIIAIDGYEANIESRVGIGRYAFEILKHIYENTEWRMQNDECTFRIYIPNKPLSDMPEETAWWQYRVLYPKQLWTFFRLPLAIQADYPPADVIFSPTHYSPRFVGISRVISIMDLSYLFYPEYFTVKDRYQLVHWTKYSVEHAKRIVTISEYSKDAIIKEYRVPPERVIVTYPGIMKTSNIKHQISTIRSTYNIGKNYILSVGTLQPRKNYVRLIEAFSLFLKKNRQRFGQLHLVIAGKKGWLYEDTLKAPTRFGVEDSVRFLDFVPDSELTTLYQHALCFALPSLYEGFGLPVLEAMAAKIPVVVSRMSSLPEVAGKAGIYVDPADSTSIADGLLAAVRQRNLKQGKWRITQGLEQVKKFTWENAARKTLHVLKEVGSGV